MAGDTAKRFGTLRELIRLCKGVPLAFYGLGVDRAWRASVFYYGAIPGIELAHFYGFELVVGLVAFAVGLTWKKSGLFYGNGLNIASAITLSLGSLFLICAAHASLPALVWVSLVVMAVGQALLYLQWIDFYGRVSPASATLYFCLSMLLGEGVKAVFLGMNSWFLAAFSVGLPVIATWMVQKSTHMLAPGQQEREMTAVGFRGFPWKPVALILLCYCIASFDGNQLRPLNWGNALGACSVSMLVLLAASRVIKRFRIESINQLLLPLFVMAYVLFMPAEPVSVEISSFRFEAAYSMMFLMEVVVLTNIAYRYGISPIQLGGIERGLRSAVELIGWVAFMLMSATWSTSLGVVQFILETFFTIAVIVLFFTDKSLSASWETTLSGKSAEDERADGVQARAFDLSSTYNLSERETEIVLMMVRGLNIAHIAEALYIAKGTVKTHQSRIYQKMSIHSKAELLALFSDISR